MSGYNEKEPMKTRTKPKPTVIERFLFPNPMWQEGYRTFTRLFGRPLGWAYLVREDDSHHLVRLDRKGNCTFYVSSASNQQSCHDFLKKYGEQRIQDESSLEDLPSLYKCAFGKSGAVFALRHLGRVKGLIILCSFSKPEREMRELLAPFDQFLASHVELAYKTFELNNFYFSKSRKGRLDDI